MIRKQQLFIGFPSKDISYEEVKTYLFSVLNEEFTLRRGKNKGRKKPTNVKITLSSENDYKLLVNYKHLIKGTALLVEPFLNKSERSNLIKSKLARRLYIGNLPMEAVHQDLLDIFQVYGEIEEIFLKRKLNKQTKKPFFIAYVTFKTEIGVELCLKQHSVYFKHMYYVLELLKCTAPRKAGSSDISGNMVVVSPHNLRLTTPPTPGRLDYPKEGGLGDFYSKLNNNKNSYLEEPENLDKLRKAMNGRFPFRQICEKSQQSLDWMGNKIKEKFDISRIVNNNEDRRKFDATFMGSSCRVSEGGWSNVRLNKTQDQLRKIRKDIELDCIDNDGYDCGSVYKTQEWYC